MATEPRIYCPICEYRPRAEDRWHCIPSCGTSWHAFWTGGVLYFGLRWNSVFPRRKSHFALFGACDEGSKGLVVPPLPKRRP